MVFSMLIIKRKEEGKKKHVTKQLSCYNTSLALVICSSGSCNDLIRTILIRNLIRTILIRNLNGDLLIINLNGDLPIINLNGDLLIINLIGDLLINLLTNLG